MTIIKSPYVFIFFFFNVALGAHLENFVVSGDYISFKRNVLNTKEVAVAHTFVSEIYGRGNLLHMICERNKVNPQKFLNWALEAGLDIDSPTRDDRLNRPLTLACRFGNVDAARFLLQRGAHIHVHNKNGRTPLMVSLINSSFEIAELLINAYDSLLLSMGSSEERLGLIAKLNGEVDTRGHNLLLLAISQRAPVELISKMVYTLNLFWVLPVGRTTCLMVACQSRDAEFMEWLLGQTGVRTLIDASNSKGMTVLSQAISSKSAAIVKLLLEAGADTKLLSIFQESYLQQAVNESAPEEIIKLLLQYNARLDVQPLYKHTDMVNFAETRCNTRAKELILQAMKFDEVAPLFLDRLPQCLWNLIREIYINSL